MGQVMQVENFSVPLERLADTMPFQGLAEGAEQLVRSRLRTSDLDSAPVAVKRQMHDSIFVGIILLYSVFCSNN